MTRKSMLPVGGGNLFQTIKGWCRQADDEGLDLIKLSIGQPSGPAFGIAREVAARMIRSDHESMHEYQDNGSPGCPDFAEDFVQAHVRTKVSDYPGRIDFLPIPGIKPMLGMVINSCGGWCRGENSVRVITMTKPGYPTPADQAKMCRGVLHTHAPMEKSLGFLFDLQVITDLEMGEGDLIMLNLPHNPCGIVGNKEWLSELCAICEERGIRVFNDAAYAILTYDEDATTLTDVAIDYPDLNWAEAFSASKAGNFTGWRIGAMVGSTEFMADIKQVKGNTDSGFNAALANGILSVFQNSNHLIDDIREIYEDRLTLLNLILINAGMRPAVEPKAGFFSLFDCPKQAFGQAIGSARLMIKNTGIVGVHFDPYIRYAVCTTPIDLHEKKIVKAFQSANVAY